MNPKQILKSILRPRGRGARPRLQTRARDVLRVAAALYEAFIELTLPLLTPAERLQLKDAAALGMPQFFRAYERILAGSAALRQDLEARPDYFAELRRTHAALLRVAALAGRLQRCAQAGEHVVLAELRVALDAVEDTAAQVAADETAEAQTRRQAEGALRFLAAYRERFAQADRNRQLRARRRVTRALDRRAELLRNVDVQDLKRELLGPAYAAPAPAVPAAPATPAPRRRGEDDGAPLPEGAPLDACLEAAAPDYEALAEQLEGQLATLSLPDPDDDRGEAEEADPLLDGDLAALLGEVLPGLRWLAVATGVTAASLHELVDLLDALARLRQAAGLIAQGARDGALVLGKLALITHDQAQAALRGRTDPEARRLRLETLGAFEVLRRSEEKAAAASLGAQRRAAAVDAETAERLGDAAAAHTAARVEAGEEVSEEELQAAVQRRRRSQPGSASAPAPASRRKRPR